VKTVFNITVQRKLF